MPPGVPEAGVGATDRILRRTRRTHSCRAVRRPPVRRVGPAKAPAPPPHDLSEKGEKKGAESDYPRVSQSPTSGRCLGVPTSFWPRQARSATHPDILCSPLCVRCPSPVRSAPGTEFARPVAPLSGVARLRCPDYPLGIVRLTAQEATHTLTTTGMRTVSVPASPACVLLE
jgi:hypothetical protein